MPAPDDLSLLIEAARIAGDIASPFWQAHPKVWEKDDDAGPVTEADLAVDAALHTFLREARPGYGWLSEETADSAERLTRERVFIVDPIDGTRSFIAGEKNWAHSLAIAEAGQITAAVVYLPMRDRLYSAARGQGAYLNGAAISVSARPDTTGATVLTARPNLLSHHWIGGTPEFVHKFRPSLAYRLALVAEGRYDAMITLRPTWEWDVAAGSLILSEAGGASLDGRGHAPLFNQPHPQIPRMIAAGQTLLPKIMERLILLD